MRTFVILFAATANLTLLDAVVKELAVTRLKGAGAVEVVKGFFNLAYVENRGCAWGMLQNHAVALAVVGVLAMALIAWQRRRLFDPLALPFKPKANAFIALAAESLMYAGILGNLIDRFYRGCVVDMFDFHIASSHFPCFNLADSYLTISVVLLLTAIFKRQGITPGLDKSPRKAV